MTQLTIKRLMGISGLIVFLLLVLVLFSVPSHTAPLQQATPGMTPWAWLPKIRSGPTPFAPAIIKITDVYYPPSLRKAREYVHIENQGGSSQLMTSWKLKNETSGEVYTFSDFTLGPGAAVDVYSACGLETAVKLYWCFNEHYFPIWDHGDTACVYEPDSIQVDCYVVP